MDNKVAAITLQEWWDGATHSGKKKYETLENLARQTGLSRGQVPHLLTQRVGTLREWWSTIGVHLYRAGHGKDTGIQGMAKDLTRLIPQNKAPFARTTLRDYIHGTSWPKFEDHYAALYAVTALPCFKLERLGPAVPTERPSRQALSADDLSRRVKFAESSANVLLGQLLWLADYHPPAAQMAPILHQLQEIIQVAINLAEDEENQELLRHLNSALRGLDLGAKRKR